MAAKLAGPEPLEELSQEQQAAEEKPARKLPLRKIGIFGAIVCVAAGAAWGVASILAPQPPGSKPAPEAEQSPPPKTPQAILYNMESIIVNLRDNDGRRYLKATMTFGVKGDDVVKMMDQKRVIVTDKLIVLLSSKKIEEIDGFDKKNDLKREIRDEINNLLGVKNAVQQVYFSELMIQ
ncbi:MAG TPA: flagellar basal body-associated FliL family protein [Planctomycetota bacterium]|nr:flagellar basal body-associated FliL family protein [Planctomycetota bacterium]